MFGALGFLLHQSMGTFTASGGISKSATLPNCSPHCGSLCYITFHGLPSFYICLLGKFD
jgi:hypothetical protein